MRRGAVPTDVLQAQVDRAYRARAEAHRRASQFHSRAAEVHDRAAACHERMGDEFRAEAALIRGDMARVRALEHEALAAACDDQHTSASVA